MSLSERQQRFVDEYLKNPNGTQAAIRAGYAVLSAAAQAVRLLRNDKVLQAIAERSRKIREQADIDAAQILRQLSLMITVRIEDLFDDAGNLRPPSEFPDGAQYLIAGIETEENYEWIGSGEDRERVFTGYTRKIKLESRLKAIELAGKHAAVNAWVSRHSVEPDLPLVIYRDYTGGAYARAKDSPNDVRATSPPELQESD